MIVIFFFLVNLLFHFSLISKLIFFPYPELFIYPYLTENGLIPYKHIFDQHFPGLMFFPINLASLGINSPADMRILNYVLIAFSHVFIFLSAKKLFKSDREAIFVNLLFTIWHPFFEGYVLWIDNFAQLIVLVAFYLGLLLKKEKVIRFFAFGFVLGLGLLFKQVLGPLVLAITIYIWLKYRSFKLLLIYFLGVFVPGLYLLYFVASFNIFQEFYYWTIEFNLTTFAQMGRKYASIGELFKALPVFGTALVVVAYQLYRRQFKLIPLWLFFVASLVFAYARFDFVHLQPALPFALLLVVFLIKSQKEQAIFYLILLISLYVTFRDYRHMVTKDVVFYGSDELLIAEKIKEKTDPGDKIFAFGTLPHIYQMTETLPSGNLFVFQFHWFMKEAQDDVFEGIKKDPPKLVIRDQTAEVAGVNLTKYVSKIDEYISVNYQTHEKIDNIELMFPK